MILYVKVTNFRGFSDLFDFRVPETGDAAPRVELRGENGARKSSVREAIAFAFTGRDSLGTPKSTHLISMGEESCEVEVMTRRGTVIKRTITRKGAQTLRMQMPGGEERVVSPAEFEEMLCPADVFLSVFVPGYLLDQLPQTRQNIVLSYILPPVDRRALVESLTGLPPGSTLDLDYSIRPDLLQKRLADQRNRLQHRIADLTGEERSLRERIALCPSLPIEPPELKLLAAHEQLRKEWIVYEAQLGAEEAEAELSRLQELPLPPPLKPFTLERPLEPRPPHYLPDEQRDRCPSCGQTVAMKHRELVRAHNDKLRAAHEEEYASWQAALKNWAEEACAYEEARKAYTRELSEIQRTNLRIEERRRQLEHFLQRKPRIEDGGTPKKPREEFSGERYAEMKRIVDTYQRDLGAYESWQKVALSADQRLAEIGYAVSDAQAQIEVLKAHEAALRQLPDAELREQKAHLAMNGYELRVDEGIELYDPHGCPYRLLSRGQRMHADFEVCLKVNSLLSRKVGMIFLDDFDLADWGSLLNEATKAVQVFTAHVWPGQLFIRLSN